MLDQSLNSAWLSKAISHAKDAGADKYYIAAGLTTEHLSEKKRLWWSCILRDRMIAIGARRSIQINSEEFDLEQPGLSEYDFESDFDTEADSLDVYDLQTKRLLAKNVESQCALAVAMTSTMEAVYRVDNPSSHNAPTVSQLISSVAEVERGKTELTVWARRFLPHLNNQVGTDKVNQTRHPSVILFADYTLLHYYSVLVALYNHLASVLTKHQAQLDDYDSRLAGLNRDLQHALTNVTDKIKGLSQQGLAHLLPVSAPSCSALPIILETINLRLSSAAQKATHQRQLDLYSNLMSLFRNQHDHAECVTTFVNHLLRVVDPEIQRTFSTPSVLPGIEGNSSARAGQALWSLSNWSDLFRAKPMIYLRLSLSLDLALSRGHAPHVTELPSWALDTLANMQAPAMALSLHLMSPSMAQPTLDHFKIVESGHDEGGELVEQQSLLAGQMTNIDLIMPWLLADNSMPDSIYENLQLLDPDGPWLDMV